MLRREKVPIVCRSLFQVCERAFGLGVFFRNVGIELMGAAAARHGLGAVAPGEWMSV